MRIQTRLAMLFLLLSVIPLIVLGSVIYAQTYDLNQQQTFRVLENSATNLKWRIELLSEHYIDSFSAFINRPQLHRALSAVDSQGYVATTQLETVLDDSIHSSKIFNQIEIYKPDGSLLISTAPVSLYARIPGGEHLESLMNAEKPLVKFRRTNQRDARMEIISPIRDHGTILGFALAEMNLRPLSRLIERPLGIGETEDVVLLTASESGGTTFVIPPKLFRKEPPVGETFELSQNPFSRVLLDDAIPDYRGEPVIAVTRTIDEVNWTLMVKVDKQEAFAQIGALRIFILACGGLLLLLVIALSRMVSLTFTRPIQALAETAEELRHGNMEARVRTASGSSELTSTCATFNQMAEQIQQSHQLMTAQLKELGEHENRTRTILNSCLDAVIALNEQHQVVEWNPTAEIIFGYLREEALGASFLELVVSPAHHRFYREALNGALPGPEPLSVGLRFESFARRRNGTEFPVELMLSSAFAHEKPLITAFVRDLSQERETRGQTLLLGSILKSSEDAIIGEDLDQVIRVWNQAATRMFGWEADEVIGKPISEILPTDRQGEERQLADSRERGFAIQNLDTTRIRKDGTLIHLSLSVSPIRDEHGELVGLARIARDISEKKKVEISMKASLREKELLLKEVHHRVKNNMQVISSLLRLQGDYLRDESARQLFKQSDERIRSMAIVHERLYRAETLTEIDLADYIKELSNYLFRAYSLNSDDVSVHMNLLSVQLGIDQAIPCGLLLNECISNAFKHAFTPGQPGALHVQLREENGEVVLSVSDNGKGIPAGVENEPSPSLGFEIIRTLIEQLEGNMVLRKESGTEIIFRFPIVGKGTNQQTQQRRRKEHGNGQHLSL